MHMEFKVALINVCHSFGLWLTNPWSQFLICFRQEIGSESSLQNTDFDLSDDSEDIGENDSDYEIMQEVCLTMGGNVVEVVGDNQQSINERSTNSEDEDIHESEVENEEEKFEIESDNNHHHNDNHNHNRNESHPMRYARSRRALNVFNKIGDERHKIQALYKKLNHEFNGRVTQVLDEVIDMEQEWSSAVPASIPEVSPSVPPQEQIQTV